MNILETALIEFGTAEIVGAKHSARVLQYFADIGHTWVKDDETAWCAAFANWVLKQAGVTGTGKLNARSFLTLGTETKTPAVGDIVVLWRGNPKGAEGHVGFYIKEADGFVYILGGNQSDKVCISAYPKTQLLAFRKVTAPVKSTGLLLKDATLSQIADELIKKIPR